MAIFSREFEQIKLQVYDDTKRFKREKTDMQMEMNGMQS
jgi:hypothetical protein